MAMRNLFSEGKSKAPLAERMRPQTLDEFVGQEHLVGPSRVLRVMIEKGEVRSLIFWGPPGTGKTTLGSIIAHAYHAEFYQFSATRSSIKEIQAVMTRSQTKFDAYGQRDLIFVDEIHRFNKSQQAAFLPYVEEGSIILIGATTENPSFEVINPLLSRSQVFLVKPLGQREIKVISKRALIDEKRGIGDLGLELASDAENFIAEVCDGDARRALNLLELSASVTDSKTISLENVQEAYQRKTPQYDKSGEEHFNTISALHKAVRNSEPDAALYWFARMLAGGDDPLYIARRMIRMATEDIGLADPNALVLTIAAKDAYDFQGSPEGELALAEALVYLATAPKSNAIYAAFGAAREDVEKSRNEPVPLHIRNAVTKLMKNFDYGKNYEYAHNYEEGVTEMSCLPENLKDRVYYRPTKRGFEAEIQKRLDQWAELRKRIVKKNTGV